MKEKELREHTECSLCKKKTLSSGLPIFNIVKIETWGLEAQACQRQQGLGMMLGHGGLAEVMGPNEDLATKIGATKVLTVCHDCYCSKNLPLAVMCDQEGEDGETDQAGT